MTLSICFLSQGSRSENCLKPPFITDFIYCSIYVRVGKVFFRTGIKENTFVRATSRYNQKMRLCYVEEVEWRNLTNQDRVVFSVSLGKYRRR